MDDILYEGSLYMKGGGFFYQKTAQFISKGLNCQIRLHII